MGQPQATATAITTACDDCGKRYKVPTSQIGKRVKCKACGNQFTITEATPHPTPKPVVIAPESRPSKSIPPPDEYAIADQPALSSGFITPHADPAVESTSPAREKLNTLVDYLLYFEPNGWVLLGCLALAVLLGFFANRMPDVFYRMLYGFPILAGVFLVVGVMTATISAVMYPEEFKAPWKALLTVGVWLLVGGLIGIIFFPIKQNRVIDDDFGLFFHRVVRLFFRVIGVAGMSVVLFLVAAGSGAEPKSAPTAFDIRAKKALEQNQAAQPHPFTVPPQNMIPRSTIDRMRQ